MTYKFTPICRAAALPEFQHIVCDSKTALISYIPEIQNIRKQIILIWQVICRLRKFIQSNLLRMLTFYCYRLNLLAEVNSLFKNNLSKEEILKTVIANLTSVQKETFYVKKSKYLLYLIERLFDEVYLIELAKEEESKIPVEGETKIEEEQVIRTPFIYIIFDLNTQIIMIQEKTSFYQEVEVSVSRFKSYFDLKLINDHHIYPEIQQIFYHTEFWESVKDMDLIKEFDLTLSAPNLFKGRQKAEDLIEELHEEFNITEVEIKLKNSIGRLKLQYEDLKNYITLAASGAGKYILRGVKNGKTRVIKSYQHIFKKTYDVANPKEIDSNTLKNDLKDIDKLNENRS